MSDQVRLSTSCCCCCCRPSQLLVDHLSIIHQVIAQVMINSFQLYTKRNYTEVHFTPVIAYYLKFVISAVVIVNYFNCHEAKQTSVLTSNGEFHHTHLQVSTWHNLCNLVAVSMRGCNNDVAQGYLFINDIVPNIF